MKIFNTSARPRPMATMTPTHRSHAGLWCLACVVLAVGLVAWAALYIDSTGDTTADSKHWFSGWRQGQREARRQMAEEVLLAYERGRRIGRTEAPAATTCRSPL